MMPVAPQALLLITALIAMTAFGAAPSSAQRAPTAQKAPATVASPVPEPAAPAPEALPTKPENPGLLNELGKLFVKPADLFPGLKLSPDASAPVIPPLQPDDVTALPPTAPAVATPPAQVAPTVATAPAQLPATALIPKMINGRSSCPISANGAPDCKAGADKLCQDNGFAGGRGLDMDSSQTCSTKALLAGARTIKDICRTETFVTRAMCQ